MSSAILDSVESIQKVDIGHSHKAIEELYSQVRHVWDIAQSVHIPESYQAARQVVVAGMGGSILGTHVIQTVFKEELRIPVLTCPDYTLPAFVDHETVVLLSSFSGTTEETLAAAHDARKKGAMLVGITSGGPLAQLLREWQVPVLQFEPTYVFNCPPRMGLGYSIFGQIALFGAMRFLDIKPNVLSEVGNAIAQQHLHCSISVPQASNPAKCLAYDCLGRIPIIIVAEHLEGVAHVCANQFNESAKCYSEYRVVPELNHHLMEGLKYPALNEQGLFFITAGSQLYQQSNLHRLELTEQVFEKNKIECARITLQSATKLTQAMELLTFGSYVTYYLALLHQENPQPTPWVDWFKSELKKRS